MSRIRNEDEVSPAIPATVKVIKRRRNDMVNNSSLPRTMVRLFLHLSAKVGAKKWRYFCMIKEGPQLRIKAPFGHGQMEHSDEWDEAQELRDIGVGGMYFWYPVLVLRTEANLVMAKMVLGERITLVYDVFEDEILSDNRPKTVQYY